MDKLKFVGGTVTIAQNDETTQALFPVVALPRENENLQGYAVLAVQVTSASADTLKFYAHMYYGDPVNDGKDIIVKEVSGVNELSSISNGDVYIFSLHKEDFWTISDGLSVKVKKTGTAGAMTLEWRLIYR
jgi:hypothetical protein